MESQKVRESQSERGRRNRQVEGDVQKTAGEKEGDVERPAERGEQKTGVDR